MNKFKVGDLVHLNPKSRWNNGNAANPLKTIGEVAGDDEPHEDLILHVEWCNGTLNYYAHTDLKEAADSEIVESLSIRLGHDLAKLGIKS